MTRRGLLIVLEGVDGSGKTTQATRLSERLDAHLTREPGGTDIGERLRDLVLDPTLGQFDDRAEALVMAAGRAQHVCEVIRPALESGRHVVTDRYIPASLAYQGAGRELGLDEVASINRFATDGLDADLVILLDVADEVARQRLATELDRIEQTDATFQQRVRDCYRRLAAENANWIVVDASAELEVVADRIARAVDRWLAERS